MFSGLNDELPIHRALRLHGQLCSVTISIRKGDLSVSRRSSSLFGRRGLLPVHDNVQGRLVRVHLRPYQEALAARGNTVGKGVDLRNKSQATKREQRLGRAGLKDHARLRLDGHSHQAIPHTIWFQVEQFLAVPAPTWLAASVTRHLQL